MELNIDVNYVDIIIAAKNLNMKKKVTIIPSDNHVYVDGAGTFMTVDCSSLPSDIHAIQWDGTKGRIEYNRSAVLTYCNISPLTRCS